MTIRSARRSAAVLAALAMAIAACDSPQPTEVKQPTRPSFSVTSQIFTSDGTADTWNAIVPPNPQNPNWGSQICISQPAIGLNDARWVNPHKAFVTNGATFQGTGRAAYPAFTANWINSWPTFRYFDLTAQYGGPYGNLGHSWTKYSQDVSGTGNFVLYLGADNCSWVYITDSSGGNAQLVGFQPDASPHANTYPVTLNGNHKLIFIVFDGGGESGGMFKLETNTNVVFTDTDHDGLPDVSEINIHHTNPNNPDTDGDGVNDGDEVAAGTDPLAPPVIDTDHDGIRDSQDNCPAIANSDQADLDGDGAGDVCDPDIDGDGVINGNDAYPTDPNRWTFDIDGDGVVDGSDNCPAAANADQADLDGDGIGDVCDPDVDGDGHANADDAFPRDSREWADTDHDGFGDNSDAFPGDPAEHIDTDGDHVGNNGDNCPAIANTNQADLDHDGIGDVCDTDIDGDGVANGSDAFPTNPAESADSDGDGVGNNADPYDNSNTGPILLVGTCNTGAANWRVSGGTWANDLIANAYATAANHGAFVSAVSDLADGWKKAGKISGKDQGAIVSCAAKMK